MKTRHVLGAMMGAALLSGTTFAQADGPQGPGPRDEGQGMRPPCAGQDGACMRRGGPGQEGGQGMMQGRRPEGMGAQQMQRGGPNAQGERQHMPDPEQLKKAGVTDQQLEALKTFAFEQKVKRIDLQASVDKAELTLGQLMSNANLEEKAAMKAADALIQARGELFKLEIAARAKAQQILGEEVVKKLHEQKSSEVRNRPGMGPRPDAQQRKDAPSGDRPQPPDQK